MRKFIEITSDDHDHGGEGWEYGTCLWSPTLDPRGAKTYNLMLEPQVGDLIIHFYREKSKRYIHGQSFVSKSCYVTSERPEIDWTDELKTSIDDVKLLCANCHRMIHHTRPAKDFEFLKSIITLPQSTTVE